jgi:hypothetical protein
MTFLGYLQTHEIQALDCLIKTTSAFFSTNE